MSKRYGERTVVCDVDWSVNPARVHGLVGPNGAGKTTLLCMTVGLVSPTSGVLEVDGAVVPRGAPPPSSGALIESPGFVPHLSGRDNLRLLLRLRGGDPASGEAALDLVSLGPRAHDRYRTYSLGMKQRLGVAAALMGDPGLLVLDEPSSSLDPEGTEDMHELVLALARRGVTVIVSSHVLADVERTCDDISVMVGGRMVGSASKADLLGGSRLRLRSNDDRGAFQVASTFAGVAPEHGVDERGPYLTLDAPDDLAPHLVRGLVGRGIDVREVAVERRALDDVYRDLLVRHS